jgi:DNA-binding transcriptional LysR family regulator
MPARASARIRHLDLNLLRVLLAIHDARGVSAACEPLHLTQPAVSNALSRLREALGDPLFVRSAQGFVPTAFTLAAIPVVREVVGRLADAFERSPAFDPAGSRRWFRVAMTDAGEMVFVPRLVAAIAPRAPGVRLEVLPLAFDSLAAALGEAVIDAAIGPLPGAGTDLRVTPLFAEHYVGLVHRGGALDRAAGRARRLPRSALRRAPLVLVAQGRTLHRRIEEVIDAEGLDTQVRARVPHFTAVPPLVQAYDALAIVPSEIAAIFEARGAGVPVALPLPLDPYPVSLAVHRRFEGDPGLGWFAERVVEVLATPARASAPGRRPRGAADLPSRGPGRARSGGIR